MTCGRFGIPTAVLLHIRVLRYVTPCYLQLLNHKAWDMTILLKCRNYVTSDTASHPARLTSSRIVTVLPNMKLLQQAIVSRCRLESQSLGYHLVAPSPIAASSLCTAI
jgi:hypothetical protein